VIGGTEIPVVETFTPGLITLPPMIVAPRLTLSGPTEGGTNVSNGDPAAGGATELVSALATLTGAARQKALRAAAATDNFRLSILYIPFCVRGVAEPQGEALVLQALTTVDTQTVVPPLKTDPMTVGPMATPIAPTAGPTKERGAGAKAGRAATGGTAGRGSRGVAAFASATGAATARAVMTPAIDTARLLIRLIRLWVDIGSSWEGPSVGGVKGRVDDHGLRERAVA
jgi:hypothetical protein